MTGSRSRAPAWAARPAARRIDQNDGVSNVFDTNTLSTGTVTLEKLEITGGHYTGGFGGAINQDGNLDLESVLVTGNTDAPNAADRRERARQLRVRRR